MKLNIKMENIKPEDFNSSGKFVNPKMESMELPNETEPEAIEEEDNSPNHYNIHINTNYVEYDIGDLYMIIIDFL